MHQLHLLHDEVYSVITGQLFLLTLPLLQQESIEILTSNHFLLKIDDDHGSELLFDLFLELSIIVLSVELLNVVVSILCIIHAST